MNGFASLLYVSVAIASMVKADTSGNASSLPEAKECTIVAEDGRSTDDLLRDRAEECSENLRRYQPTGNRPTLDEIRATVRDFCGKLPDLERCMDEAKAEADACGLNDTQQTALRLFRQHKVLEHVVGCGRNGEDLEFIIHAIMADSRNNVVQDCKVNATASVDAADGQHPNAIMAREYRVLEKHRECLERNKGRGCDETIDKVLSMVVQLMDRMKCDQDGADVLCKTIISR